MTTEVIITGTMQLDNEVSVIDEITRLHSEVLACVKIGLTNAIRIGELLTEQKSKSGHGYFMSWISANLPFSDRTARNYMKLYEQKDRLETETISNLTAGYKLLASPVDNPHPERPMELYLMAMGKLAILNNLDLDGPEFHQEQRDTLAITNTFLDAMKDYQVAVDATDDRPYMIGEYSWLCKAMHFITNSLGHNNLRTQARLGGILNQIEEDSPELYKFLAANKFSNEACEAAEELIAERIKRVNG